MRDAPQPQRQKAPRPHGRTMRRLPSRGDLGRPSEGGPTAEFTTDGSTFYITATGFDHGGYFDPKRGITAIYIGPARTPPTWNPQRDIVTNTTKQPCWCR